MDDAPVPELTVVDRGHYAVEDELARGGMGRILRARDQRHGRQVAIKELLADTPALRARFHREALITARLQHPAIVPVYEAGRWPSGEPFYAMKMVDGRSLDEVIAERKTMEARLGLLHNVIAVAEAIAYAHRHHIIHRDLKPANVLVGGFGETVVIDWGLAKDLDEIGASLPPPLAAGPVSEPPASSASTMEVALSQVPTEYPAGRDGLTMAGRALGTPAYMAPEQARGDTVDARVDVYALGALLYHLLAGKMPYADSATSTGPELVHRVSSQPPTPLASLEPKAPRDLIAIVERAMAREPGNRYADAGELAADLRRFETGQLVSVRAYSPAELFRRWLRRNRVVVGFALLLVVVLAVGGAVSVTRIVRARDRAEQAQAEAETAQRTAEQAQAAAETALADKERAQASAQAATIRAATASSTAEHATAMATDSQHQAQLATTALLGLWVESKMIYRLHDCYLAHWVRGSTRLPTTISLVVSDKQAVKSVALAGSPSPLQACVTRAVRGWAVPPSVPPGSYAFPLDVDPQTAEPRIGTWVSDQDWLVELVRRRYSNTLTRCYQKRLIDGLADKRSVTTSFVVQTTGKVDITANKLAPADDAALVACLRAEVADWQLPRPVDDAGQPTTVPVELATLERAPPPAGLTEICPFGHSLWDEDGTLVRDREVHSCTAHGWYDDRSGKRVLGWHTHDPQVGNAR